MATFTLQAGGVPPGTYRARFSGVEPTTHVDYGPGLRFGFLVLDGDHAGQRVSRVTTTQPTLINAAGKMLAGLAGRALSVSDSVDPDDYKGREYCVKVEAVANGATRVAAVEPAPAV